MRFFRSLMITAFVAPFVIAVAQADMEAQQGTGKAGGWASRVAVKPDPSKIVVPKGYKVGVFSAGLDTPSAAAVDGDGNVWVAISGNLFGGGWGTDRTRERQGLRQERQADQGNRQGCVQDGDERDRLLRREQEDLHPGIRREDLGNRRRQRRAQADRQGPADRRPPQRRHHLQGRLSVFRAGPAEQRRFRRSRQPRLDRHAERSVLGRASRRLPGDPARSRLPRPGAHRPEREVG